MKIHFRTTITCALLFVSSSAIYSQSPSRTSNIVKGTTVVLKFNSQNITTKFSVWSGIENNVQIEQNGDGEITLNGSHSWRGIPLMVELEIETITRKKEYVEVILKGYPGTDWREYRHQLKLRFGGSVKDIERAFEEVVFVGAARAFEKSDYFKKEVIDAYFPKVFRGALSNLDTNTKLDLMRAAGYSTEAIVEFKRELYLSIRVVTDIEYNTLKLNQAERTSQVVEQKVLFQLRALYKKIGKVEGLKGIKVTTKIGYRSFLESADATKFDELELYAPLEEIAKFDDADITNQELIDKSVVLINGNRVSVSLTQFSN